MATYAKKIAHNWVQKPAHLVLIKTQQVVIKNRLTVLGSVLTYVLDLMLTTQVVQKTAPGVSLTVNPKPIQTQVLGLAQ